MDLFKQKKIVKVEIISQTEGLSGNDQLTNYAVGHMMDGFDGVVAADIYNDYNASKTLFLVYYDNGTTETICVKDDSQEFNYYIQFI